MRILSSIFAMLVLSSCATLSQLSVYTISESDIEQILNNQLDNLQKKASLAGIPVSLNVDNLSVNVGPEGREVVRLGTQATAVIGAFGLNYPLSVTLEIEGKPFYDSEEKAIFVRSLSLRDSTIDAGGYKGNIAPLSGEFMMLLNGYLSSNPVYKFDEGNAALALLSKVPLQLSVEKGQLELRAKSS